MLVFYAAAVLLVWLGILSLRGGFRFLAYVKQENSRPQSDFTPFASIIAPCRGLDEGLQKNLAALFRQDYPDYEVVFVVDDQRDAATQIIQSVLQTNSKLVVAGKATNNSQKVHNLRRAVLEASSKSEILVFVDSDARPSENWLRALVAPLRDKTIGAATGYRWFVSKKGNFASEMRAVWNASIASALGANMSKNFCWGGATAIRLETFKQLNILGKWEGAASDDFALTNALQTAKLGIYFVPNCLTASVEDCNFRELLEFSTRQMKITRVYAPHLWKASLVGSFLFTTIFWTGVYLTIRLAIIGLSFWLPLAFLILIFALGAVKAGLRLKAVKLILLDYQKQLNRSSFWQLTFWTITPAIYLYNSICAGVSRQIIWRGILYELKSPHETIIKPPSDK
jgi:cellulose synthase/poly-beta-1,6-N-acetylglucosamine synthase-like glycosyltransferase